MKTKYYLNEHYYYDRKTKLVYKDNKICDISFKQLQLLTLLVEYEKQVCPYQAIYEKIWDGEDSIYKSSNTLRALVFKLKRAIPQINIKSYSGMGYILYPCKYE